MISGVVLARNEEANIVGCLEALRPHVAEILLIDMESSDRTVELARPFVSKVLPHPRLTNFDGARNVRGKRCQEPFCGLVCPCKSCKSFCKSIPCFYAPFAFTKTIALLRSSFRKYAIWRIGG